MTGDPTHVVCVHGVGTQGPGFAAKAQKRLVAQGVRRGHPTYVQSAHWAPVADQLELRFKTAVKRNGTSGNMTQSAVIDTAADALVYLTNPLLRSDVHARLDSAVARLRAPGQVTFVCHSLGVLVACDYLRERSQTIPQARMVSMGCNLGLFTLGQAFSPPPQIRGAGSWLNLYDQDDALGFPLRGVVDGLGHVVDKSVSVGKWWWGWTGASHIGYWDDSDLFEQTIPDYMWGEHG